MEVILLWYWASFQQCFLYSQKVHNLGIILFLVLCVSPSCLYVSQSSLNLTLLNSAVLTVRTMLLACCKTRVRSSPKSSGDSTTAHSPVDLFITIHPPKGNPCDSPYRCPCVIYPNASSSLIASYPLPNLLSKEYGEADLISHTFCSPSSSIITSNVPFIVSPSSSKLQRACSLTMFTPDAFIINIATASIKSPKRKRIISLYELSFEQFCRANICWHIGLPILDIRKVELASLLNCFAIAFAHASLNSSIR